MSQHSSRMRHIFIVPGGLSLVLLLLATLTLTGCSDDPTDPFADRFGLTVTVETPDGTPVSGLRTAVSPALDDRYVNWPYAKGRDLPPTYELTYRIYDLEGRLIRRIVRESVHHFVVWTGLDDNGQPVHDGVYRFEMDVVVDDEVVSHDGYLVFITGDPDHFTTAVTDEYGRFTVRDPTYVPSFYNLEPIEVITYPEGEQEILELRPQVRVTLLADDGRYQAIELDVAREPRSAKVIWEPKGP